MVMWEGGDPSEVTFSINQDFLSGMIDFDDLRAALELFQAGRITKRSLFELLLKGEVIAEGRDFETYERELDMAGEGGPP